jgi:hypothetical protein
MMLPEQIAGEDPEDTRLLKEMLEKARGYLTKHAWCPAIRETRLAFGIGGIIALFLVQLEERIAGTDDQLWVVVGDLPSAYFVIDDLPGPQSALDTYCSLMEDWVEAVLSGHGLEECFPVEAMPSRTNALALKSRLAFLRQHVLPQAPK